MVNFKLGEEISKLWNIQHVASVGLVPRSRHVEYSIFSRHVEYSIFSYSFSKLKFIILLKVIALYCIAHPYCARFVASLARARPGSNRFPMRLSSPEKRKVIYS